MDGGGGTGAHTAEPCPGETDRWTDRQRGSGGSPVGSFSRGGLQKAGQLVSLVHKRTRPVPNDARDAVHTTPGTAVPGFIP